ncbi:MAG TPA: DUF4166 domain-containing protein [Paracoccaceae bacterium]|nr:DUF4166 domain-containing protein [Paracoccaceae bacterium]
MKILILGGYGVFGGRLAELLADISGLEIVICGRSLARAKAFCAAWRGQARVTALQISRDEIRLGLAAERPALLVDASGPFQDYGDDPYSVVEACITSGVDYLDFADAADFVFGVSRFDAAAKAAGIFVLSGASSFPVLTAAVLRQMAKTMDIQSVEGGIAPSPYAGIGLNVMRAVVGYAGSPVKLLRNGVQTHAPGLTESRRFTIAVPGRMPLKNTRFSLVDVPDLQVIPPEHATLTDIWMGAGPVPESLHRILNLLAKARAAFGLPSLSPLSGLFYKVLNLAKFGEHRGGMFVRARGWKNHKPAEQTWHLLAEGDDGPYIPSMAIEAIIRKLLDGNRPAAGAGPATNALELADYERLFQARSIHMGLRGAVSQTDPMYQRVLGAAFETLPDQLKAFHGATEPRAWEGRAQVRRGSGVIARSIAGLIGFPAAGADVPVRVTLSPEQGGERWVRNFDGQIFSSVQRAGTDRNEYLIVESFGVVSVAVALVVEGRKLFLVPRKWWCCGLSLPKWLLPAGRAIEAEQEGRFLFDVEIVLPLIGLIVAYRGTLRPVS